MNQLKKIGWTFTVAAILASSGCSRDAGEPAATAPEPEPPAAEATAPPTVAVALLAGREGSETAGKVTFIEGDGAVEIQAMVTGVAQDGAHGFHIHAVGDCSAADFTSAGGHFNPTDAPHGGPTDAERHAGDLGNIDVVDGSGSLALSSDLITLAAGAANSVVGKGVILHAGTDDLVSQPTGDAGGRLACGVIELEGGGSD